MKEIHDFLNGRHELRENPGKSVSIAGCGGTRRRISELEASLVYRASVRTETLS